MPGGSEIRRDAGQVSCGSRHCSNHKSDPGRSICHMGSGEMPQTPLDPITRDRIPNSTADHKANACPVVEVPLIPMHGMDD
jgi:hypothetical protein